MIHGETVHSMLPQDLPWWAPDHAIFFGVLYGVILVIGSGMGCVIMKSLKETFKHCEHGEASHH